MKRVPYGPVRDGWRLTNYSLGLTYNDTELPDGTMMSYWQEGPYYDFSEAEIEELETATAALNSMCLDAGDWMVRQCPRSTPQGRRDGFFASVCGPPPRTSNSLMSRLADSSIRRSDSRPHLEPVL